MQIEAVEAPEGAGEYRWAPPRGEPEDQFFKITRDDGASIVVGIPNRAFDDYGGTFGLNMVFMGHYE